MRKFVRFFIFSLMFLMILDAPSGKVFAAATGPNGECANYLGGGGFQSSYPEKSGESFTLNLKGLAINTNYTVILKDGPAGPQGELTRQTKTSLNDGTADFTFKVPDAVSITHEVKVDLQKENQSMIECSFGTFEVKVPELACTYKIIQQRGGKSCYYDNPSNSCLLENTDIKVEVIFTEGGVPLANKNVSIQIHGGFGWLNETTDSQGKAAPTRAFSVGEAQGYEVTGYVYGTNARYCQGYSFSTQSSCTKDGQDQCLITPTEITPTPEQDGKVSAEPYQLCNQIPNETLQVKCEDCAGVDGRDGVWTAIGCIKRDPKSIVQSLMQIGLGMGGGVALISVLAGGFILSTSQGDPQKANQAKEIITNSIIGLLFIIFSVVILQFIGVTIFNIPGFGSVK